MVVLESNNRHAEHTRKSLQYLKDLSASLEGWEFSSEKNGVKLYTKQVEGLAMPMVRGDTVLQTTEFTPRDVASVATLPGARKIWDEKYDTSEVKEQYTPSETFFWVKLKAPWPVSPRDFAGTAIRDLSDDVCFVVMSSVVDPMIPEVSGCVRGHIVVSGWKFYKTEGGIGLTYITQVDLAGSIPTSFLKNIQLQVPLCAGKVAEYIKEYGFPPHTISCTATMKKETFDHGKREHIIELDGTGGGEWVISRKMYPNGVKVHIDGQGESQVIDNKLVVKGIQGPATIKINKA
ncbi:uncharacterized protein BYT42DRAFT_649208 [Radiomyces spectabilis]|uniref:uncharacterized protein n=1 Tax=Radiomyces spectabilis TaxID=64574 RepID=UPI002220087B|nr:uncharacterized protein BYT42DRAFT_649208 [Radiomyces spectabilis]KAI8365283.1 hypothetical protein BYT42DRAFT_649208 [Radiomyces spectabilis]